MNTTAWAVLVGAIIVIFGGILWTERSMTSASYATDDPARPIAVLEPASFDLGTIGVDDEPSKPVTLRNDGQSPLEISKVATSCDCTFATVTLADASRSPEFSMHTMSNWTGTIEPGQSATIDVVYRPAVMPVTGNVSRGVNIATNDPNNPMLTISFEATVQ